MEFLIDLYNISLYNYCNTLKMWQELGTAWQREEVTSVKETNFQSTEAKINGLLQDIFMSFRVSAGLFDISGRQLGCCGFQTRSGFCRFIHFYDPTQICRQSYIQGFCQCQKEGRPLIYFCPFGLVNITFPVPHTEENPCFVTAGPLLYRKPDDSMIGNILNLNCLLKPRAREVRQNLGEIAVRSEAEVQSMAAIIQNALEGATSLLIPEEILSGQDREDVVDSLEQWLKINPNEEDTEIFLNRAIKAALPPKATTETGYSSEELAEFVTKISDSICSGGNLALMISRTLKYCRFLLEFSRQNGVNLEQLFYPNGISIERIAAAGSRETLERYLVQCNTLFLNSYAASREVRNKDAIFRAMHYIRSHYSDISLRDVADHVGLNSTYFSNLFKRSTGQSYSQYLNKVRIEESKRLLLADNSLSEIAQKVGFSDQSYFTNVFKKVEGISPHRWKNAQKEKEVSL